MLSTWCHTCPTSCSHFVHKGGRPLTQTCPIAGTLAEVASTVLPNLALADVCLCILQSINMALPADKAVNGTCVSYKSGKKLPHLSDMMEPTGEKPGDTATAPLPISLAGLQCAVVGWAQPLPYLVIALLCASSRTIEILPLTRSWLWHKLGPAGTCPAVNTGLARSAEMLGHFQDRLCWLCRLWQLKPWHLGTV